MQGKVEICGVNTARLKVLDQTQMDMLLRRAKEGDKEARQMLIEGNLRLVLSVIQRFDKRGETPDDLFQVGCIGLIKAIENFDPTKQVRFSTYGVPTTNESRGTRKGVSSMTRKQALAKAIELLSHDRECAEVIQKLGEIRDDLPLVHWSDGSIRDTVEQFILDHGRVPRASDFKKKGLPPHPVVKQKYKITVGEWLDQNYPVVKPTFDEIKEKRTKAFLDDYHRIKPRSSEEFNRERTPGTFGWMSVARYYHTRSWRTFLKMLDLPLYFDMQKDHIPIKVTVNVHLDCDFCD